MKGVLSATTNKYESVEWWHEQILDTLKVAEGKRSAILPDMDYDPTTYEPTVWPNTATTRSYRPSSICPVVQEDGSTVIFRKQKDGEWSLKGSWSDEFTEQDLTSTGKDGKIRNMAEKGSSLIAQAATYYENGFNVLLIGPHGTGKTASIQQLVREEGITMKYFSCSTLDPFTDLVGVPYPRLRCDEHGDFDSRTEHKTLFPECLCKLEEHLKMVRPHDVDSAEIIFFDEFNRADTKTMNAIFEIIQFRTINGEPLPNLKACWAAMNPPDENYDVERTDPALLDRFDLYIPIQAKPSVSYMAKSMPEPIARALHLWWNEHDRTIKNGRWTEADYISPRRLEKIGIIWVATRQVRSVTQALPVGINFERTKLINMLKAAQKQVDQANGIEVEDEPEDEEFGVGDRPWSGVVYQSASLKANQAECVAFLKKNPLAMETHNKMAKTLRQGVGGTELGLKYGPLLDSLAPSVLEGLVAAFPATKKSQMRDGFAKFYKDDPATAKTLTHLHGVLKVGANAGTSFPMDL